MKHFGKRVLSFIVAMGIVATMLPVNVLAEEISSSQSGVTTSSSSEPAATETPAPTTAPSSSEDSSSSSQPQVTATPTPVPSPSDTPVPTASATPEPSASPTPSPSPSPTPTPTPEESAADRIKAALEARKAAIAAAGADAFGTDNRTQTEITPFKGTATQLYAPNGTSYIASQTSLVNLVVFMRFKDQNEYLGTDSAAAFNKVYNSNDGSYYSLKHYLETMSYGTVSATGAAFPRSVDGQTFVSVQLSHPENYYKPYSATNTIGYTTQADARSREGEMLTEAVNGAKAQISGVYTDAQLDVHGAVGGGADGYLDAITFAYLPEKINTADGGIPIEYADLLWPHKSSIISGAPTVGSKAVGNYSVIDASEILNPADTYSSTVIHEFLHILGMPDLYRYYTTGYPLYNYDVMAFTASDSLGEPQSLLQYNIRNMMGFAPDLSEITATTSNVTLKTAQYATNSEQSAVVIKSPYSSTEYFVVEMKQSTGVDDAVPNYGTDGGLLVYRVNLNVFGNASGPPDQEYAFRPADTSATATQGQPYYAVLKAAATSGYRSALGKARAGSTAFDNDTLFFSDGTNSGIIINNLRASGTDGITFDVTVPTSTSTGVDQWLTVGDKTYYQYADGSYATGKVTIDSKLYIFDADGVQLTGNYWWNGQCYYAPADQDHGALKCDYFRDRGNGYTYYGADGAQASGWFDYTGNDGVHTAGRYYQNTAPRVVTGALNISGSVYVFDTAGKQVTTEGWYGNYYIRNSKALTGKVTIDSKLYIFGADGVQLTGNYWWNGQCYYAPADQDHGALKCDYFRDRGNGYTYYGADGAQASGWFDYTGNDGVHTAGRYYQNTVPRVVTGPIILEETKYFFDDTGRQLTQDGWLGSYYVYADGTYAIDKVTIGGKLYIFGADGVQLTGNYWWNGQCYYAPADQDHGALKCEYFRDRGNGYTYYGTDGAQASGWFDYIGDDGVHTAGRYYQNTVPRVVTGPIVLNGIRYFLDDTGRQLTQAGWSGSYYVYADGTYATGKVTIDSKLYIFGADGVQLTGNYWWNGQCYYAPADQDHGALKCDYFRDRGNGYTYYGADGAQASGWFDYTGSDGVHTAGRYYQNTAPRIVTGSIVLSDIRYFFDNTGRLLTQDGWIGSYYVRSGQAVTGKVTIDSKLYIFGADGVQLTGNYWWNGQCYYAPADQDHGALKCDYFRDRGNGYTYYGADGAQASGWFDYTGNDGVHTAGRYYQNTAPRVVTGALNISGSVYVFDTAGKQVTTEGWYGNYYIRNSKALTGKVTIDSKLYIFGADGVQLTGNYWWNGQCYYAPADQDHGALKCDYFRDRGNGYTYYGADGAQASGWFDYTGNDDVHTAGRYYQNTAPRVVTGALNISGSVYVFDTVGKQVTTEGWYGNYYIRNSKALTGKVTIDSKLYIFGADGVQLTGNYWWNGQCYYAPADQDHGALKCDYFRNRGDGYTYYGADGAQASGWFDYTGNDGVHTAGRYYQNAVPRLVKDYLRISNKLYYFESTGILFQPSVAGFFTKGNTQYYFNTDGSVVEPPKINSVDLYAGSTNTTLIVNINASFTGAAAVPYAYSFDGGATWQAYSSKEYPAGSVIAAGQIRIRDSVGYVVIYDSPVNVSSGTMGFGIDVSSHQGVIDWAAMKASGVKYAVIRAVTWKGSTIIEDPYFRTNVRNAKANGIYVGAYIYSYAFNTGEMKAEVDAFNAAGVALKAEGYTLDMPVFIDYEDARLYSAVGCPATNDDRTNIVRYGMQLLQSYGYASGFYTYRNFALNKMNGQQLINEGYDFWLAHWNVAAPSWSGIEMWQYGSASVGGMTVDANMCYKNYTETITGTGGGTHVTTEELFTVFDLNTKQTVTASMQSILSRIVANEIGKIAFSPNLSEGDYKKACQVQAVAAHSWLMYEYSKDVVAPSVGLKTLSDTYMNIITPAVGAVMHGYILYNNKENNNDKDNYQIAFTPYYSSSGGYSNPSEDYWGQPFAYLTKVDCRAFEEKWVAETNSTNYYGITKQRTAAQLRADILKVQPNANLSGQLSTWIVPTGRNASGYYTQVSLGGVSTPVDKFYEGVVGPYSMNFTMQVNGNDSITFTSYGNGHCVGMSQYAMLGMVRQGGYSVADILQYFYPGTIYKTIL